MESTQRLPEDVLVAVLRRLPPDGLAAARCVCKDWNDTIDARHLLRLFPSSLAGLFINFFEQPFSEFFLRPPRRDGATAPAIGKLLHHVPGTDDAVVMDHCNGPLLLCNHVANPTTRHWAPLPPEVARAVARDHRYIVFDPAISPHYQVLIIPLIPWRWRVTGFDSPVEWPPSPCTLHVFSSATGGWEAKSFARRGDAIGTVANLRLVERSMHQVLSAHWRGKLFVLNQFVMRISLSSCSYQAIKPPIDVGKTGNRENISLGRSESGVYFASFDRQHRLLVCILNDSHNSGIEWVLKHDNNLHHMLSCGVYDPQVQGPWIIEDINYTLENAVPPIDIKHVVEEDKLEWDSDNDDIPDTRGRVGEHYTGSISILGFHPYKEVIFLNESISRGLAYHLSSSKLEDLGNIYPINYGCTDNRFIDQSFPYTPYWIGELPGNIQSKSS